MSRYLIQLSYNGTRYHGWQIQPNAPTIQEKVNDCLSRVLRESINVVGCGRTDTGVHAKMFYAHFDVNIRIDKVSYPDLIRKLNSILPPDIAIQDIFKINPDTHARFDAVSRTYQYRILREKDPFLFDTAYPYFHGNLELDLMNKGADILKNYTDFTSFSKLHTDTKTNDCNIIKAFWEYRRPMFVFTITADRFLRNMVRAIVGTLIELGMGKIGVEELMRIIENKDRSEAGFSVPAKGLFLMDVSYPFVLSKEHS